jgi:hypothetical protein
MARTPRPLLINLVRQYHELDRVLAAVNDAVRQAESIYSRGISAEADLHTAIESMRAAREIVRGAIDQTGALIDDAT